MAIEDKIREIKTQISHQQARVTRAQVEKEGAERRRDAAVSTLASFGVSSPEQAREKIAQLQAELDATVQAAETALKESGA